MGLLIDKKETKTDFEYRIKKKNWIIGWVSVLLISIILLIYSYRMQNGWVFLGGIVIFFVWIMIVSISAFPLWLAMQPFSRKIVTKDTKEGLWLNVVWKVKK